MNTGDPAQSKIPSTYWLSTKEPKHWWLLCDTCNDSYICTTWHAILLTHLWCFWCLGITSNGLSALIKCYVMSRTTHPAPRSSNRIDHNHDSSFGFRSCWKHVIHHTISVTDFHTSMGIPLASWNRTLPSSHQSLPILSTSSGISSVCDWQHRTLHLPDSLSKYGSIVIRPMPQVLPIPF